MGNDEKTGAGKNDPEQRTLAFSIATVRFVAGLPSAQKEAAETDYWLEIYRQTRIGAAADSQWLSEEARQLLAIFTTINRKAKGR